MKSISLLFILTLFVFSCKSKDKQNSGPEHHRQEERPRDRDQRPSADQLITEMDSNNDGQLSKNEVKGPLSNDFEKIDTNNDGVLTKNELENAPGPRREREHQKPPRENKQGDKASINIDHSIKVIPVNKDYFISKNIIGGIKEEMVDLNGMQTLCYVIKTNSQATEHTMGPWCPKHIDDGMEKAGIWFENGKVYDVSGHFIAKLDEFYKDNKWKLYRTDGSIKVTDTKEGCLAAAKPNVEEAYQNYCVECLPEYFKDQITTFTIPVTPKYLTNAQKFGRGGIGVAFNGVKFDPPAPTHAILAAHTIAPLDDHGGHVNPHGGYHYHAVTGSTKEVEQTDNHAPMIGYAMDGFGIYALIDKNENKATNLDDCGGHSDDLRGYHYHAGAPGDNQIIKCLHGLAGYTQVQE